MGTWQDNASRTLTLLEGSSIDAEDRTWQIMNHVLDESHDDRYISHDFFNVQQTAGGLPDGVTFEDFITAVAGHVRTELAGGSFDDNLSDDDVKSAALTFDASIRQHIAFLDGAVHQAAAGDVHLQLWNLILQSRSDDSSIYSCYRDFLVDA